MMLALVLFFNLSKATHPYLDSIIDTSLNISITTKTWHIESRTDNPFCVNYRWMEVSGE